MSFGNEVAELKVQLGKIGEQFGDLYKQATDIDSVGSAYDYANEQDSQVWHYYHLG